MALTQSPKVPNQASQTSKALLLEHQSLEDQAPALSVAEVEAGALDYLEPARLLG